MVKIRNFDSKVITMKRKCDTEYVIGRVELKEGIKIPLLSDSMLKTMFMN